MNYGVEAESSAFTCFSFSLVPFPMAVETVEKQILALLFCKKSILLPLLFYVPSFLMQEKANILSNFLMIAVFEELRPMEKHPHHGNLSLCFPYGFLRREL